MKKKRILYCDDQERFTDLFHTNHDEYYDITTVNTSRGLVDILKDLEKLQEFPDLVLLDLYYPRAPDQDYETRKQAAEDSLSELDAQIIETNKAVLNAWKPHGIDILKQLRGEYPSHKLPIAIYTQKGLLLLDDSQIREVEESQAHWLLKKRLSPETEEITIERIIRADREQAKTIKLVRRYRIGLIVAWFIVGLLLAGSLLINIDILIPDIWIQIISGSVVSVISYIVSRMLDKNLD